MQRLCETKNIGESYPNWIYTQELYFTSTLGYTTTKLIELYQNILRQQLTKKLILLIQLFIEGSKLRCTHNIREQNAQFIYSVLTCTTRSRSSSTFFYRSRSRFFILIDRAILFTSLPKKIDSCAASGEAKHLHRTKGV